MSIKDANINIQPILTKEQIAYDEALKNIRYITARLKISQEGINVQDVSPDKLEIIITLFDQMEMIQRNFNIELQKLQQDANNNIMKLQEDSNKKLADIQNRYRELINFMKGVAKEGEEFLTTNITMSKEREEEIKKELADALAKSKEETNM